MSSSAGDVPVSGESVDTELSRLRAENEALRTRVRRRTSIRKWLSVVLVVLTSLSVVATTVAVWAHETALDTDRFMETVEPALSDAAFYSAVSDAVSEEALVALDIEARVTARLEQVDVYLSRTLLDALDVDQRVRDVLGRFERPSLTSLAPPISTALETRVIAIVDRFITSEEFTSRFPDLVRRIHQAAVALVRNELAELPNVYIEGGEVRLNLIPIITEALRFIVAEIREFLPDVTLPELVSDRVDEGRRQLADAVQAQLPEDFGQVTMISEDRLAEVQETARRLDRFVWLLAILSVVLGAVTIAVSPTRRRTVIQLAIGIVAGLVLAVVIIRRLEAAILEQITNPDGSQAARAVLSEVISSLRTLVVLVAAVALVAGLVAYLAGGPAWTTRFADRYSRLVASGPAGSELDRWTAAHHDMLRIAGVAVALVAVFIVGLSFVSLLVIGGLLALQLWAISGSRRRIEALAASGAHADAAAPPSATDEPPAEQVDETEGLVVSESRNRSEQPDEEGIS